MGQNIPIPQMTRVEETQKGVSLTQFLTVKELKRQIAIVHYCSFILFFTLLFFLFFIFYFFYFLPYIGFSFSN